MGSGVVGCEEKVKNFLMWSPILVDAALADLETSQKRVRNTNRCGALTTTF